MEELYKNKEVEVLKDGPNFATVKYIGDEDYKSFSVRSADLIEKPIKKLTSVQRALIADPTILAELLPYVVRIELSSSPAGVDSAALAISENTSITEIEAVDYIRVTTDRSHAAKYDVIILDTIPAELRERSKVFFNENGHRARVGELQVGSKSLALWLMSQGLLPEKQMDKVLGY
jgi:hypothetical protein